MCRWSDKWEGPEEPFAYLRALVSRGQAMLQWVKRAQTNTLYQSPLVLAELFHPDTFLNALRQQTARQRTCISPPRVTPCNSGV